MCMSACTWLLQPANLARLQEKKLTAEGLVAPVDQGTFLSAVVGEGGKNIAVTRPLGVASANL